MKIKVRLRRYTEAEALASAFVPAVGQPIVVTMANGDIRQYFGDAATTVADFVQNENHLISLSKAEALSAVKQTRTDLLPAHDGRGMDNHRFPVFDPGANVHEYYTGVQLVDFVEALIDPANIGAEPAGAVAAHAVATDPHGDRAYTDTKVAQEVADRNTAIAAATVGLYDNRGTYDASVGAYPATGGSGAAGAILKGDTWRISVGGTIGALVFSPGDTITAEVDTPGQTASNWGTLEHNVDQATEAQRGTAAVATQAEAEDSATTNNEDIITPRKWWMAWAHGLTLPGFVSAVIGSTLTGFATADVVVSATDTILQAIGHLQGQLSAHRSSTSNPHSVTKSQVGLGNVPNVDATDRTNHTGTQTASSISNFANTVLGTVLSGLSVASAVAVTSANTILEAIGHLQAQINARLTGTAGVEAPYTGTDTYTAGVQPSGASTKRQFYTQVGNLVTWQIMITWANTSTTCTNATLTFPTEFPTPAIPAGFTGASVRLYQCMPTRLLASPSGAMVNGTTYMISRNAANNGFEIMSTTTFASGSYRTFIFGGSYFTQ